VPAQMSWPLEATRNVQKHSANSGFHKFQFHFSRSRRALVCSGLGVPHRLHADWSHSMRHPYNRGENAGFVCKAFGIEPTHFWMLPLGESPCVGEKMKERMCTLNSSRS
jgi:hypothetical protein